mgnify:CR=1 FL=1
MNVLLSIKPEFAEKILSGEKRYEFRKTRFRDPSSVGKIYLYSSSPIQRIVGQFTLGSIIEDKPEYLWEKHGTESGIASRERFMGYFEGRDVGYALEVTNSSRFPEPIDPWKSVDNFRPPVSFEYLDSIPNFLNSSSRGPAGSD